MKTEVILNIYIAIKSQTKLTLAAKHRKDTTKNTESALKLTEVQAN